MACLVEAWLGCGSPRGRLPEGVALQPSICRREPDCVHVEGLFQVRSRGQTGYDSWRKSTMSIHGVGRSAPSTWLNSGQFLSDSRLSWLPFTESIYFRNFAGANPVSAPLTWRFSFSLLPVLQPRNCLSRGPGAPSVKCDPLGWQHPYLPVSVGGWELNFNEHQLHTQVA